jgi:hypothetical protein
MLLPATSSHAGQATANSFVACCRGSAVVLL